MITVFRYLHRRIRDKRVTTHCALVSRAFGVNKFIYVGDEDLEMENTISNVEKRFGKELSVEFANNWFEKLKELKNNSILIHLTMYGKLIDNFIKEDFPKIKNNNFTIFIGSTKVPKEVYQLADYNISITNQPHSEISALAITLDRINPSYKKKQFHGKIKIIPNVKKKEVIETQNI